jgi:hypothetical protein
MRKGILTCGCEKVRFRILFGQFLIDFEQVLKRLKF